eukprot:5072656-Pyramimonas_sp.AAC.1
MLGAGTIKYPNLLSGLCKAPEYGLLRLIPTRREFPAEYAEHAPRWLSQRKDREAPPAKVYQAEGSAPAGGRPLTQGTWPHASTPSFWETYATHNENWQYVVVVFKGRVVTRLGYRICRDGTLAKTGQTRFNDSSRTVQLTFVEPVGRNNTQQMMWNLIFSQDWSALE